MGTHEIDSISADLVNIFSMKFCSINAVNFNLVEVYLELMFYDKIKCERKVLFLDEILLCNMRGIDCLTKPVVKVFTIIYCK